MVRDIGVVIRRVAIRNARGRGRCYWMVVDRLSDPTHGIINRRVKYHNPRIGREEDHD